MRALAATTLLLLAGCVGPAGPATDGPSTPANDVLPWTLEDCRYIVGWSEADPAIVQAHLPEGFTVLAGAPLGLPAPAAAERALIGTEAFECASGSGLDGPVQPMRYGSIWIPVAPPDELADPDISMVYYKIHVLVPDAPRREAMEGLGLSVGDGAIAWDAAAVPGGLAATETIEGAGDFRFELLAPQETAASDGGEFMEITPGSDGRYAVWRAAFSWSGETYVTGRGFIDWPADHWVAEAIGSARAPAAFHAGVWSFDGTLTLPPR